MSSESIPIHNEIIGELESSVKATEIKGKSLFVTATGLTKDFVSPEIMERDHWTFKGKEVRWRHKLPEKDPKNLIGHIHEVYMENEELTFIFEVWGYRDDLVIIQEQIKNNEVSISAGYRKITDANNKVIEFYGREASVTPFPKCTKDMGCGIESTVMNEDNTKNQSENDMPDENKEIIKMLKESIAKNEDIVKDLKETNVKLVKERGEQIVRLEGTISAMESRISDSNEIITEQTEKIESLEKDLAEKDKALEDSKTSILRSEIVTLENITEEESVKAEMEELLEYNEKQLTKMKERLMRVAKIAVKTTSNKPTPVLGEDISQNEGIDALTPEQLTAKLNPQLRAYIEQNERASGKAPTPFSTNTKEDGVPII